MQKKYKCCICKKELKEMPIRLVKQIGDNKESYRAFHNIENYDFCERCYKPIANFIEKHKKDQQ